MNLYNTTLLSATNSLLSSNEVYTSFYNNDNKPVMVLQNTNCSTQLNPFEISLNITNLWNLMPVGTIIMRPYNTQPPMTSITGDVFYSSNNNMWLYCNGAKITGYCDPINDSISGYWSLYAELSGCSFCNGVLSMEDNLCKVQFYLPDYRQRVPWGYKGTGERIH